MTPVVSFVWRSTDDDNWVEPDFSAFLLDRSGQVQDFVFYGHTKSNDGSVVHYGDEQIAIPEGIENSSEEIKVYLDEVPSNIAKIIFYVNLGPASKAEDESLEAILYQLCAFDFRTSKSFFRLGLKKGPVASSMALLEFYRDGDTWEFKALYRRANFDFEKFLKEYPHNLSRRDERSGSLCLQK